MFTIFSAGDGRMSEFRRLTTIMNIRRHTNLPPSPLLLLLLLLIVLIVADVITSNSK